MGDKVLFCTSPWCRLGTCSSSEGQSQAGRQPRRLGVQRLPLSSRKVARCLNSAVLSFRLLSAPTPAPSRRNLPRSNRMGRLDGLPIDTRSEWLPAYPLRPPHGVQAPGATRPHLQCGSHSRLGLQKNPLGRRGDRLLDNTTKMGLLKLPFGFTAPTIGTRRYMGDIGDEWENIAFWAAQPDGLYKNTRVHTRLDTTGLVMGLNSM